MITLLCKYFLIGLFLFSFPPLGSSPIALAKELSCNGSPNLCDRLYNDVTYLMAHNAQSHQPNPLFYLLPGSNIHNQSQPIETQLENGVRAMKMPVHFSKGKTQVCHGMGHFVKNTIQNRTCDHLSFIPYSWLKACDSLISHTDPCWIDPARRPLATVLGSIKAFLDNHPNEVLTLFLEDDTDNLPRTHVAFEESGIIPYMHSQPQDKPWPTLRQMILQNHRFVVFVKRWHDLEGKSLAAYPELNPLMYFVWSSPYHYETLAELGNDGPAHADQARASFINRDAFPRNKLWLLQHFITPTIAGNPKLAAQANRVEFIQKRVEKYQKVLGSNPNFISVDFYHLPSEQTGPKAMVDALNQPASRAPASKRSF